MGLVLAERRRGNQLDGVGGIDSVYEVLGRIYGNDFALVHEVEQAAWGRGHNVDPALQGTDLSLLAYTSEDYRLVQTEIMGVSADFLADLDREFAGGRKNQCPR